MHSSTTTVGKKDGNGRKKWAARMDSTTGVSDREHHREFRPRLTGAYKHGDHGYDGRFGDKIRYRDDYRHAYLHGYEEGYHGNMDVSPGTNTNPAHIDSTASDRMCRS